MTTPFETLYQYVMDTVLIRADLAVSDPPVPQPVTVGLHPDHHTAH